jgi:hypothetical protein
VNLAVGASAFVAASSHDYHLSSSSPAIDAGIPLEGVTADRDGSGRPQGGAIDVGAYEFADAVTPPLGGDVVLHAARARTAGAWQLDTDATAASGIAVRQPDAGGKPIKEALASPVDYVELTFAAEEGVPYRVWIRGRADANLPTNDSAHVQFSGSLKKGGPAFRIGSTTSLRYILEACGTCGLDGWGWQTIGRVIFESAGQQTIRIQTREDGLAIDQIVLSPATWLVTAPGAAKRDSTILPESR